MTSATNQPILIIGLGLTGQALVRYFLEKGRSVVVYDDNPQAGQDFKLCDDPKCRVLPSPLSIEQTDAVLAETAPTLYTSPGIREQHPLIQRARHRGKIIATDIDLYLANRRGPCIGVTGTNGKSTVATMIAKVLNETGVSAQTFGNIGRSVLDALGQDSLDYAVIEVSSFQLHYLAPEHGFDIGVLTNIAEDHLDFHQTMARYISCKHRIFKGNRLSVYFKDQPQCHPEVSPMPVGFGYGRSCRPRDFGLLNVADEIKLMRGDEQWARPDYLTDLPLCYTVNLMPALAVVNFLDLDIGLGLRACQDYRLLAHRFDIVASEDGVRWVDASKATNPSACVHSLPEDLNHTLLILGGQTKGADLAVLPTYLSGIKFVAAYSDSADAMVAHLPAKTPRATCQTLAEAVQLCSDRAQTGDTVLLAPAGASQPLYRNYRERGQHFNQLVQTLTESAHG